ncbi:MAG: sodium:solute symporter, partial [Planctomycetota bacterium]
TAGGRNLSGWLCGMSIFATYLSSISYLALPGKAFVDNWNAFLFSLVLPLSALVAVRFFVPLYRQSGEVSAYAWLERRFGLWARVYASCFYLLYQVARIAVVMYLMALPMTVLFGWDIRILILMTGVVVTVYSFVGGIVAVIWADAVQAIVLLLGALLALAILLAEMPGGLGSVIEVANAEGKFSLMSPGSTVWCVLAFGFFDNLRNFGMDQSYIQRYISARSDREAVRSVWLGALLYVPVSALFLFIGSSLYAFYESHPDDVQEVRRIVASQRLTQRGLNEGSPDYERILSREREQLTDRDLGDRVFPHFMVSHLPTGVRGLLIAAVFAAAMSTVSTSLNSSATLVMSDFYRRLFVPNGSDADCLRVLRFSTIAWGVMGTGLALMLVRVTESALDIWWLLSGLLGAAIIGLFLLGLVVPSIRGGRVAGILMVAMLVVAWMVLSPTEHWPSAWGGFKSPMDPLWVSALGPLVMISLGLLFAQRQKSR